MIGRRDALLMAGAFGFTGNVEAVEPVATEEPEPAVDVDDEQLACLLCETPLEDYPISSSDDLWCPKCGFHMSEERWREIIRDDRLDGSLPVRVNVDLPREMYELARERSARGGYPIADHVVDYLDLDIRYYVDGERVEVDHVAGE